MLEILDLVCRIDNVRYVKDTFSICGCSTEQDIPFEAIDYERGGRHCFVVLGQGLPVTQKGAEVVLSGRWVANAKYGLVQLMVTDCRDYVGRGRDAIVSYLSSSILRGVGIKFAELMYDKFGDDVLRVLTEEPQRLLEIPGIKQKKLDGILASFEQHSDIHVLSLLLSAHGVSYRSIMRISRTLGVGAAARIRENPYILCKVSGFSFVKADAIARSLGNFENSPFRLAGAIMFVLDNAQHNEGHLFLPRAVLTFRCCKPEILNGPTITTKITEPEVDAVLTTLIEKNTLTQADPDDAQSEYGQSRIYLNDAYIHENLVATTIARMIANNEASYMKWDALVETTARTLDMQLDAKQEQAVIMGLSSPISVMTGGPGTGKTSALNVMVATFRTACPHQTIELAAPTGRAARRMTEQTGVDAHTLHSLLGLVPNEYTDFSEPVDEDDLLDMDMLVVDEASMLDMRLAAELFYRISPRTRILFVGDVDQLPSVGPGNVLRQFLACRSIPNTRLETVFRQESGSIIPINAQNIKRGRNDLLYNNAFKLIPCDSEEQGAQAIQDMYQTAVAKGIVDDIQILAPMRQRGATCTSKLNEQLHDIANPPALEKAEVTIGLRHFRVGDKVMQTRNIVGASNGDIGYVLDAYQGNGTEENPFSITIRFDASDITYGEDDIVDVEPANAITIHKSQGSEFSAVIIPIFQSMSFFLHRNLLYTAVTRAKRQVVLVGEAKAIAAAIYKEDTSKRNTVLAQSIMSKLDTMQAEAHLVGIDGMG